MFGHIIIIISAIPTVIKSQSGALGCFSVGLIFFGIGVGGFKPNVSPLYGEQLKDRTMRVKTLPSGERVIVDPAQTTQRMVSLFRSTGSLRSLRHLLTDLVLVLLLLHQHRIDHWADLNGLRRALCWLLAFVSDADHHVLYLSHRAVSQIDGQRVPVPRGLRMVSKIILHFCCSGNIS